MGKYRQNAGRWFRQDDANWTWPQFVLTLFLAFCVVGLYALGSAADDEADIELQALAQAERTDLATPRRLAAAYEAGMAAAMKANRETPRGVELAQACAASGFALREPAMKAVTALEAVLRVCLEKASPALVVQMRTGLKMNTVSSQLSDAKKHGFLEDGGLDAKRCKVYAITSAGMTKLSELAEATPAKVKKEPRKPRTLSERALQLVLDSDTGLDSFELADELECTQDEADQALAMHVAMQTLVTCKVQRSHALGGVRALAEYKLYRNAAAATPWGRTAPAPAAPAAAAEAQGVRQMIEAIAGPSEPGVLHTSLPVYECDIDAVHRFQGSHRQSVTEFIDTDSTHLDRRSTIDVPDFVAALYSDGVLVIESNGTVMELPLVHTRQLMHYLDHMRAGDLVAGLAEVL